MNNICRAKCKHNGKWTYGHYVEAPYRYGRETVHLIINCLAKYEDYGEFSWHNVDTVDPTTVCRCTGLTDKNGTDIYEHDYVRTEFGRICEVVWFSSPAHCGWDLIPVTMLDCAAPSANSLWASEWLTVLGNKFDNTELME